MSRRDCDAVPRAPAEQDRVGEVQSECPARFLSGQWLFHVKELTTAKVEVANESSRENTEHLRGRRTLAFRKA